MRKAIGDAVEEVSRLHGIMGYIKAVITAFGTIGVGALIAFFPPESLREEIPIHRELGFGFMVFGGLFVLALFADSGPGSIGQRAKSLLLGVITAAFAAGSAICQLGPHGLVGYALAVMIGLFSLSALWEFVSGRPGVTSNP